MCHPADTQGLAPAAGRPRWASLYGATVPQLLALAVVEASAPAPPLRAILRWALALGTVVAMALGVPANRSAFDLQEWCSCAGRTMTVRVVSSGRVAPEEPAEVTLEPSPALEDRELVAR